eukprot:PhM_4_TR289/c0_g1_i1/m.52267
MQVARLGIRQQTWVLRLPVHAVYEHASVRDDVLVEHADVLAGVFVVVRLVKVLATVTRADHVARRCHGNVDVLPVFVGLVPHFGQVSAVHVLAGQEMEHLLRREGYAAAAGHDHGEWADLLRQSVLANELTHLKEVGTGGLKRAVLSGEGAVQERRREALGKERDAETVQRVDKTGEARVGAELDNTTVGSDNAFIINEPNVLLENCVQEGHIVRLGFDGVREHHVRAVGYKQVRGHFFYGDDRAGGGKIFVELGTSIGVLIIREASDRRRLHNHLDALVDKRADLPRRQGCAALPLVLVLAADGDDAVAFEAYSRSSSGRVAREQPRQRRRTSWAHWTHASVETPHIAEIFFKMKITIKYRNCNFF